MQINPHIKLTLAFLTTVILIDFMGMATVVVLFPKLLIGSSGIFSSEWSYQTRIILMGTFLAVYPLGQVIGASVLGKLSDYYGRKPLLLLTLLGTLLGFVLSGLAVTFQSALTLFFSRLLAGLCAGNVAIAQASLLDISTTETKAKYIGYSQMAMGSAYIVGPILGGLLSQSNIVAWFNMSTPFWFFSLILLILIVVTAQFYKETLLQPKREQIDILESSRQIYQAFTSKKLGKAFLIWLLFVSGWWLFESFMPAFLLQNFNYDTVQIGYLLAFNGALYASFQYIVVQRIAKNMRPIKMVSYSAIFAGLAIIAIAFVEHAIPLYISMSVFVMAMGFSIPGLITHISNLSDATDQGQVMGIVNSIQAISTVLVMLMGGILNSINASVTVVGGGLLIILSWLIFVSFFVVEFNTKMKLQNTY